MLCCQYRVKFNICSFGLENTFLNERLDAAVTMGMILMNEAEKLKGDAGKKRSKFSNSKFTISVII